MHYVHCFTCKEDIWSVGDLKPHQWHSIEIIEIVKLGFWQWIKSLIS